MRDQFIIAGRNVKSRFLLGTGKFPSNEVMSAAIKASGAHIVTAALRRIDLDSEEENILDHMPEGLILMTNTSGARDAEEAVRIARLSRAMGAGDWIKIEVIADNKHLLPDNAETIKAAGILAREGFIVMPYFNPDLADARRLRDAGAASLMPLGAPIGTNKGLCTKELIKILVAELDLPVIVDAGLGRPSQAAEAMELGVAAVLVNTAVATAQDPAGMAGAFALAVEAGRLAYLSGPAARSETARASSPLTGFLG